MNANKNLTITFFSFFFTKKKKKKKKNGMLQSPTKLTFVTLATLLVFEVPSFSFFSLSNVYSFFQCPSFLQF